MVHVVVEVPRPYSPHGGRPPLLPGTFVDVRIAGRTLSDAIAVPRHTVHEGDTVWVADGSTLRIREVEIARADRETAYITGGIEAGERIVVTPLDAVSNGMRIRTTEAPVEGGDGASESGADVVAVVISGDDEIGRNSQFSVLNAQFPSGRRPA
jgi:hypothetical protein